MIGQLALTVALATSADAQMLLFTPDGTNTEAELAFCSLAAVGRGGSLEGISSHDSVGISGTLVVRAKHCLYVMEEVP